MKLKCFNCSKCNKDFWGDHPGYIIVFDKCRGKTCPDCGKVRKLGKVRKTWDFVSDDDENRSYRDCGKCHKMSEIFLNGICIECFYNDQKNKGCVCPFDTWSERDRTYKYYCSLCEKFHRPSDSIICKNCSKKQDVSAEQQRVFWKIVLPSAVIGIIIGFFLGWLFLVKLRRKKNKT